LVKFGQTLKDLQTYEQIMVIFINSSRFHLMLC